MDVENHLYARKDIKQLGIAPMTSMFSCGNNGTPGMRHHSSGKLMIPIGWRWRGNGEWICPLNNPQKLQFNAYMTITQKRFGLLQPRSRGFLALSGM